MQILAGIIDKIKKYYEVVSYEHMIFQHQVLLQIMFAIIYVYNYICIVYYNCTAAYVNTRQDTTTKNVYCVVFYSISSVCLSSAKATIDYTLANIDE